jgi:hypothetical protein
MTTQISTKLAALGMALTLNAAMIGGVAYLFNGRIPARSAAAVLVRVTNTAIGLERLGA